MFFNNNSIVLFIISITIFGYTNASVRTCHKCEGINCYRTTYNQTEQCLDPLDICVTIFKDFQVVQKGCYMNLPSKQRAKCDNRMELECHMCNEHLCNNLGRDDFMCVECDSSKDENCSKNPSSIMPTRCASPTTPNSYCYVKYEGSVTMRGCSTDMESQNFCYNSNSCMLCLPGDILTCNTVDFDRSSFKSFLN